MAGLFGAPKMPAPVVTRMPSLSDQTLRDAANDQMMMGKKRKGRQSTILSDSLASNVNGSAGELGA